MEEGQYKLFNILKEIQEWWEAQAIVAVIGQNASMDSEEEDTHARNFTLPWACPSINSTLLAPIDSIPLFSAGP